MIVVVWLWKLFLKMMILVVLGVRFFMLCVYLCVVLMVVLMVLVLVFMGSVWFMCVIW